MQRLIINPESGMAGDMFISALISAGIPHEAISPVMREASSLLGGADIRIKEITRAGLAGILLDIKLLAPPHSTEGELVRKYLVIALEKEKIAGRYRQFALDAFSCLITAEEQVHKKPGDFPQHQHHHHCHLHEAQDILIDITGAAWALQYLQIDLDKVTCLAPVITGSGKIHFSHGTLDVPAPATAAIIKAHAIPAACGSMATELLTPTGAALLAALKPGFPGMEQFLSLPGAADRKTAVGFGTKDFSRESGLPNALILYLEG